MRDKLVDHAESGAARWIRASVAPVLYVLAATWALFAAYNLGPLLVPPPLLAATGLVSGLGFLVCLNLGVLWLYPALAGRGVPFPARVLVCLLLPVSWIAKEIVRISAAFALSEALFYLLSPLSVAALCAAVVEAGAVEMILVLRGRDKGRGRLIAAATLAASGLAVIVVMFAWRLGEEAFYMHLALFRMVFGPGVGL